VPVLVVAGRPAASWVERTEEKPARFRTNGVGRQPSAADRPRDVDLVPFYRLHRRTYSIYWDLVSPGEWSQRRAEYAAEAERQRRLEAATIAFVRPGDAASEAELDYRAGDRIWTQNILGRTGRTGASWFSYDLPLAAEGASTIIATYYSGDRRGLPAEFEILIDGARVAIEHLRLSEPHEFFDLAYTVPDTIVRGVDRVAVRFQAAEGSRIATVFGIRMVRGAGMP